MEIHSMGGPRFDGVNPKSEMRNQGVQKTPINFPKSDSNAGKKIETVDEKGNRIVTEYNADGSQFTVKHYQGISSRLYFTKTHDAQSGKLVKEADYDFTSGKLYQEVVHDNDNKIIRHYDKNGSFCGQDKILKDDSGNVKKESYDSNGVLTGYSTQVQTGTRRGRPVYEIRNYDAQGNLIKVNENSLYGVDTNMIRK